MEFKIRNESWVIQFVPAQSPELQKSDGSYTIGVTDQSNNTVYLADHLTGSMLDRVLCHELTHAVCMTYNLYMPIETEEEWNTVEAILAKLEQKDKEENK